MQRHPHYAFPAPAANMPHNMVMSVMKEFHVVVEKDKAGWYVASVPALRGCHTQAKSLDTLIKRIRQAIELCLEVEEPPLLSPNCPRPGF